jgi:primary-amine oxidase
MRKRGIRDFDKVQIDTWAPGIMPGDPKGVRLLRAVSYYRGDNAIADGRPIEGVVALVDMNRGKVIEVHDRGVITVPSDSGDFFDAKVVGKRRSVVQPLVMKQPAGASFTVRGHEVRWENWHFRFALHPREGLVLYTVGYEDGGRVRPILYRASMCEMMVPYAEEGPDWVWRAPFDMGEYGLGRMVTTLRRGHEVPEYARLFDVAFASDQGTTYAGVGVIALYEQDGGILWTHTSPHARRTETRRSRQLVLNVLYTVGNYDYGMKWIFHQDGSLALEMELSGVVLGKATAAKRCPMCEQKPDKTGKITPSGADRFGTLVAPQLLAPHHQHFMCFRLDMDVDGTRNTVSELNVRPLPPTRKEPTPKGFFVEETRLRTENEAQRPANPETHRRWKVFNPTRRNAQGHSCGYVLLPGATAVPLTHPKNTVRQRARFLDHPLSVTRQRAGEMYPAGTYPNQSRGGEGLPRWVNGEGLENTDVVLWYTVGMTHVARPEEWPVMPVERGGFRLVPHGFFNRNPALDLPGR